MRRAFVGIGPWASWAFVFAVYTLTVLPRLAQLGMFVDGVVYATLAHNPAQGIGSFWAVQHTEAVHPVFYDHPPLAFGLQSLLFRAVGDSVMVERVYSFDAGVLTLGLVGWLLARPWTRARWMAARASLDLLPGIFVVGGQQHA